MIIAVSTILMMTVTFDDAYAHNDPQHTPHHCSHVHENNNDTHPYTITCGQTPSGSGTDSRGFNEGSTSLNVHPQVRELNILFQKPIDTDNVDLSKFVIKNQDGTRSITLQGAEIIDVSSLENRLTIKMTSSQANTIKGYTGTTTLGSQRGALIPDQIMDWRAFELLPNALREKNSITLNTFDQGSIRMHNVAPDPTLEELKAKVRTLEAQIKTLESANKRLQTNFDDAQNACLIEQSSSTPVQQRSEQQLQTDGQGTPVQQQQQQQQQQVIVNPVNLIENGSFESPTVTNSGGWQFFTDGTADLAWTVSDKLELHRNILGGASDGQQHVELDATRATSTTISQTLNTVSDQKYTVSFDYKARPGTATSTNGITVTWNSANIAPSITFGDTWQTFSVEVTGTSSDIISFADAGISDGAGTFLDNVSVIAILP